MKKNKFSKNWIIKQKRDIYVKKSKLEGYRSRAVYKLQEINDKFKIIKNNISVIDLGAAPGSWSQYISRNFSNRLPFQSGGQVEFVRNFFGLSNLFSVKKKCIWILI